MYKQSFKLGKLETTITWTWEYGKWLVKDVLSPGSTNPRTIRFLYLPLRFPNPIFCEEHKENFFGGHMAQITLGGQETHTSGEMLTAGSTLPRFFSYRYDNERLES
jgi:hypothetical protein